MARFRRRRLARGFRRAREPVGWFRQNINTTSAVGFGSTIALELFTPENVTFGAVDTRVTVRRIIAELQATFVYTAAAANIITTGLGIYMGDVNATTFSDPLLGSEEDQEADWLYLARETSTITAGAQTLAPFATAGGFASQRGLSFDANDPNIRAMRKLEQQQRILCVCRQQVTAGAPGAPPTQTSESLIGAASILWSRTMR